MWAVAALLAGAGCGDADGGGMTGGAGDGGYWDEPGAGDDTGGDYGDGGAGDDTGGGYEPPPPEVEVDLQLRQPAVGDSFLYVPSTNLDALVVVDAATLDVELVETGIEPILVRALPADDGAVVLAAGTEDITVVRRSDGGWDTATIPVIPSANRLTVSEDGAWAFAWYTHTGAAGEHVGSLQDVTAVRLAAGDEAAFNLAVGLRPEEVVLTTGGDAIVVCEDGLSVVTLTDLDGDTFLPPIPLHDDLFVAAADREVVVTADGAWAVVRDLDRTELTLIDVAAKTRSTLELPDFPSDLDLTPDGTRVVVPFRELQTVAVIGVPDAFGSEDLFYDNPAVALADTGHPFGVAQLTADGARALLYTTQPGTLAIGQLLLDEGLVVVRPLAKEVLRASLSANGATAILVHSQLSGLSAPESTSHGYTVLDLEQGYTKLVLTSYEPTEVALTEDGAEAYVLLPSATAVGHAVHRVVSFAVTTIPTAAAPTFVGLLPDASQVAVMLDDPTGWLTFIDVETGAVQQVNSFELNSQIR